MSGAGVSTVSKIRDAFEPASTTQQRNTPTAGFISAIMPSQCNDIDLHIGYIVFHQYVYWDTHSQILTNACAVTTVQAILTVYRILRRRYKLFLSIVAYLTAVCVSRNDRELCKNGWIDRNAVLSIKLEWTRRTMLVVWTGCSAPGEYHWNKRSVYGGDAGCCLPLIIHNIITGRTATEKLIYFFIVHSKVLSRGSTGGAFTSVIINLISSHLTN